MLQVRREAPTAGRLGPETADSVVTTPAVPVAAVSSRVPARAFLPAAEVAEREMRGPRQVFWLGWAEQNRAQLRSVLANPRTDEDVSDGLRLAGSLWWFWWLRGHWAEGRALLGVVLAAARVAGESSVWGKALFGAATLAHAQCDLPLARALYEETFAIARGSRQPLLVAHVLNQLGGVARDQGRQDAATALFRRSLRESRRLGDEWNSGRSLLGLARVALGRRRLQEAEALCAECGAVFEALGATQNAAAGVLTLGHVRCAQGDSSSARVLFQRGHRLYASIQSRAGQALCQFALGDVARDEGDDDDALAHYGDRLWTAHA
ncbi:MAG: tetratricopeptide repeat protein, partial [Chloroflexota bacterium]